jgi:hypothetical protein
VALGVGGTLWAEQRVRRTLRRATPQHAVAVAGAKVAGTRDRVRAAVAEGQRIRADREAELWADLGAEPGRVRPDR